jgi:hypothetical protein
MTDLFTYHVARQQMADLRGTAGQTRLTTAANHYRFANDRRRVIRRVLSRISTTVTVGQRSPRVAPHTGAIRPGAATMPQEKPDDIHSHKPPRHCCRRDAPRDQGDPAPAVPARPNQSARELLHVSPTASASASRTRSAPSRPGQAELTEPLLRVARTTRPIR